VVETDTWLALYAIIQAPAVTTITKAANNQPRAMRRGLLSRASLHRDTHRQWKL